MAILTTPKTSAFSNLGEPPPKGMHLAVCLDVVDTFNDRVLIYERPYGSENEDDYEYKNHETFIFGVKCKDGSLRKITSRAMPISLHEKSNLRKFLTSWMGESPKDGLDSSKLKGKEAQLTLIEALNKKGNTYIRIEAISEVMEELKSKVPKVEDFVDNNSGPEIPF